MKKIKLIAIILILLNAPITLVAQDLEFSQFLNAPTYLNPAFTGVDLGPRFILNYRNQWAGLGNAYISYAASYDQHVNYLNGGIGVSVVSDRQANGLYIGNSINGSYAYQINLSKKFALNAGAQISLVQKRIDVNQLVFNENINPLDGTIISSGSADMPDVSSQTFADFGFGALIYTRKFFGGFTIKHITQPDESLITLQSSSLPIRWGLNAGFEFHSNKNKLSNPVYFTPNLMFAQQAKFNQLNAGFIFGVGVLYGGFYYRTTFANADALILMTGIKKGVFKFGYSFDANISSLSGSAGTHELSLMLNFHDSKKIKSRKQKGRFTDCPDIF